MKWFMLFLAAILFTAAFSKVLQVVSGDAKTIYVAFGILLLATLEFCTGLANCVLKPSGRLRLINLLLFSTFFVYITVRGMSGVVECGCFGRISTPIWRIFAFDGFVCAALIAMRPNSVEQRGNLPFELCSAVSLVLGLFVAFPTLVDSVQKQVRYGVAVKPISTDPIVLDPLRGINEHVELQIENRSGLPVQILNAKSSWCMVQTYFEQGTLRLGPREKRNVILCVVRDAPYSHEKEKMISAIRSGMPLSRVPERLDIQMQYQDLKHSYSARFYLRMEPSKSYASFY